MSPLPVPAPRVSVIVCTYNRPGWLRAALGSVLAQDVDAFEVLVVDDGSEPPVRLPPESQGRCRLVRTPHRGVGAARAAGLDAARGELVAYCDDDDAWAPGHLRALLLYLEAHPEVDLVYGDSVWRHPDGSTAVPYSVDYDRVDLSGYNYVFATDVLHRARAARAAGGFDPSLRAHEDWDLWLRMGQRHLLRHLPVVLASHAWHPDAVSATPHWDDWARVYGGQQARLGRDAPERRAARVVPFDRRTWREGRRELLWHSLLRPDDGFGAVGRRLLRAVERRGVEVRLAPFGNQPVVGFERLERPLDHWGRLAFHYDYRLGPAVLPSERIVQYSMWESTAIPAPHVDETNRVSALLYVPCAQNREAFREAGVRVPIEVLPHGVDPEEFPGLERRRSDHYTFGTYGALSPRKGIDVLLRAFLDEFSPAEPVRLILKTVAPAPAYRVEDPRVVFRTGFFDHPGLLDFLRQLDAFVLPSRGEGFGLCGLEAMATGLPLIATDWSGPADYLDPEDSFPLAYRLVEARGTEAHRRRFFGLWAEPDEEHLRSLMRWLYEHPEDGAKKGRLASQRIHTGWTWDRVARQMCEDLDAIASE